jgi:DNA-binding transcriptional MerR regulator
MTAEEKQARVDQMRSQGMSLWEIRRILNQEKLEQEVQEAQTVEDLKKVILSLIRR